MGYRDLPPIFWPLETVRYAFIVFPTITNHLSELTLDMDERLTLWLDKQSESHPSSRYQRFRVSLVRLLLKGPDTAPEARTEGVVLKRFSGTAGRVSGVVSLETQAKILDQMAESLKEDRSRPDQTYGQPQSFPDRKEDQAIHLQNIGFEKDKTWVCPVCESRNSIIGGA